MQDPTDSAPRRLPWERPAIVSSETFTKAALACCLVTEEGEVQGSIGSTEAAAGTELCPGSS